MLKISHIPFNFLVSDNGISLAADHPLRKILWEGLSNALSCPRVLNALVRISLATSTDNRQELQVDIDDTTFEKRKMEIIIYFLSHPPHVDIQNSMSENYYAFEDRQPLDSGSMVITHHFARTDRQSTPREISLNGNLAESWNGGTGLASEYAYDAAGTLVLRGEAGFYVEAALTMQGQIGIVFNSAQDEFNYDRVAYLSVEAHDNVVLKRLAIGNWDPWPSLPFSHPPGAFSRVCRCETPKTVFDMMAIPHGSPPPTPSSSVKAKFAPSPEDDGPFPPRELSESSKMAVQDLRERFNMPDLHMPPPPPTSLYRVY
ncbi:uncharacterized protein FIBRA_09627 [Fibroporia radiculosa]|uniref:Uncharacterized protein n=1 Tax=Fibroporia radiculosa TaxID=599839 RepID=J4H556_9APHY|nr:uncharacterized protein FIBRA_09627 [Fibroporia radiculosa]CCM06154.1 predicted protein [Fibroporia radiculosa]